MGEFVGSKEFIAVCFIGPIIMHQPLIRKSAQFSEVSYHRTVLTRITGQQVPGCPEGLLGNKLPAVRLDPAASDSV